MWGAEWCVYCQRIKSFINLLALRNKKIIFLLFDIDKNEKEAELYRVDKVPSFWLYKQGVLTKTLIGKQKQPIEQLFHTLKIDQKKIKKLKQNHKQSTINNQSISLYQKNKNNLRDVSTHKQIPSCDHINKELLHQLLECGFSKDQSIKAIRESKSQDINILIDFITNDICENSKDSLLSHRKRPTNKSQNNKRSMFYDQKQNSKINQKIQAERQQVMNQISFSKQWKNSHTTHKGSHNNDNILLEREIHLQRIREKKNLKEKRKKQVLLRIKGDKIKRRALGGQKKKNISFNHLSQNHYQKKSFRKVTNFTELEFYVDSLIITKKIFPVNTKIVKVYEFLYQKVKLPESIILIDTLSPNTILRKNDSKTLGDYRLFRKGFIKVLL
ncbi:thioredoxin [Anaeramoeba flamelloides]|uniref:Thioredoxin n=1 Tax=Anaeramoeba flamelloides TaxID=1746091 RepID=A0AAV7ZAG2_9EUKA|nr:thioredoxin [Anaeramoeba flamelloides]